jgi:hypothetical protein
MDAQNDTRRPPSRIRPARTSNQPFAAAPPLSPADIHFARPDRIGPAGIPRAGDGWRGRRRRGRSNISIVLEVLNENAFRTCKESEGVEHRRKIA